MKSTTELFKVLSDETRLRIINLIYQQDLCVCELVEILDLSQPKISKHIARLRQIELVNTERNEQFIYYKFNHENSQYKSIVSNALTELKDQKVFQDDLSKLKSIETFVCSRQ